MGQLVFFVYLQVNFKKGRRRKSKQTDSKLPDIGIFFLFQHELEFTFLFEFMQFVRKNENVFL